MNEKRHLVRGFVVLEGIDGTGTTTQLKRLDARLSMMGRAHSVGCEPTSGPVGRVLREALSGAFAAQPATVARLFAADRTEHIYGASGILERAGRGELVVSDRYIFSSLAYQGLTCGPSLPAELNASFPLPELLLFFDIDPAVAMRRVTGRDSLEIYEKLDFQIRVADAYRKIVYDFRDEAASVGMRIATIDAAASPDEVEAAVWSAVEPLCG